LKENTGELPFWVISLLPIQVAIKQLAKESFSIFVYFADGIEFTVRVQRVLQILEINSHWAPKPAGKNFQTCN
jgi:hypothetical protein